MVPASGRGGPTRALEMGQQAQTPPSASCRKKQGQPHGHRRQAAEVRTCPTRCGASAFPWGSCLLCLLAKEGEGEGWGWGALTAEALAERM